MECKYCGAPLDTEDAFCRKCGARAPSENESQDASAPINRPENTYTYDRRPYSGKAIAGFVVSLVGVVTFVLFASSLWAIWLPCAIAGLLLSVFATRDTARLYRGKGLATAGLVMASFTLVFSCTFLLLWSVSSIINGTLL